MHAATPVQLALAVLHVSMIKVPRANGAFLIGIVVVSVAASALLATRGFA